MVSSGKNSRVSGWHRSSSYMASTIASVWAWAKGRRAARRREVAVVELEEGEPAHEIAVGKSELVELVPGVSSSPTHTRRRAERARLATKRWP
jgi:hypothetical protein